MENLQLTMYEKFMQALDDITKSQVNENIPISVTIDAGALDNSICPLANNTNCPGGFNLDEIIQIARAAGANSHVAVLHLTEFSPSADDSRLNMVLLEILYHFSLGYSTRPSTNNASALGIRLSDHSQVPHLNESVALRIPSEEGFKVKTVDYNNEMIPAIPIRQPISGLDLSDQNMALAYQQQQYSMALNSLQSAPNSSRRSSGPPTPVAAFSPDSNTAMLRSAAQQALSLNYQQGNQQYPSAAMIRHPQQPKLSPQQQMQALRNPYSIDSVDMGLDAIQGKNIQLQQQLAVQQARNAFSGSNSTIATNSATNSDFRPPRSTLARSRSNSANFLGEMSRTLSQPNSMPGMNRSLGYTANSAETMVAHYKVDYNLGNDPHPYDESTDLNFDASMQHSLKPPLSSGGAFEGSQVGPPGLTSGEASMKSNFSSDSSLFSSNSASSQINIAKHF